MTSRSYRNNNPGNVDYHPTIDKKYGATLETGVPTPRFAHFATAGQGLSYLVALLTGPDYRNLSIEQAINKYAPGSENDTKAYIDDVCQKAVLTSGAVLSFFDAFQWLDFVRAIIEHEGYKK
jgi:hypothetical protein